MGFTEPYGPADQIEYIAKQSRKDMNSVLFGEITFSVRAGRIYRVDVNRSVKLDAKILDEARDALDAFKNHDYANYKNPSQSESVI